MRISDWSSDVCSSDLSQVAVGRRKQLRIFGGDWPTVDGTGVRDYIHVMDLARAHADAIDYLVHEDRSLTVNLGTGQGVSVLELVRAFARASGREVRSAEHTSDLQSLMRTSYAVFCLETEKY